MKDIDFTKDVGFGEFGKTVNKKITNIEIKLDKSEGINGLIGINLNEDGSIKHDEKYEAFVEHNRIQKEKRLEDKRARIEAEETRRAALTPKERLREDIEIEIRSSEESEIDFDTLVEMFKKYNELE